MTDESVSPAARDFAEVLGAALGTDDSEPATPAEPVARLPAPNPAQGSSGAATPQVDHHQMFADELRYAVLRADGTGGWRTM